jgi:hypothetical protein
MPDAGGEYHTLAGTVRVMRTMYRKTVRTATRSPRERARRRRCRRRQSDGAAALPRLREKMVRCSPGGHAVRMIMFVAAKLEAGKAPWCG